MDGNKNDDDLVYAYINHYKSLNFKILKSSSS